MNAAVVHAFDSPPTYTTFADPIPLEGEKLVTITAAGLHPIVKSLANGTHYGSAGQLPFIPGVDGVGRLEDGTRVYFGVARSPFGTFAELGVAASWMCIPLPDGLDDATAAGLANPGMSSWVALTERRNSSPARAFWVLGATGSAGQLAIQIAKRLGARRVVAAGRNPNALEKLQDLGADSTISLEQDRDALIPSFRAEFAAGPDSAGGGIDVVLDYLWGAPAEATLAAIAQKGLSKAARRVRFVQIGSSAGPAITLRRRRCAAPASNYSVADSAALPSTRLRSPSPSSSRPPQPIHFRPTSRPFLCAMSRPSGTAPSRARGLSSSRSVTRHRIRFATNGSTTRSPAQHEAPPRRQDSLKKALRMVREPRLPLLQL